MYVEKYYGVKNVYSLKNVSLGTLIPNAHPLTGIIGTLIPNLSVKYLVL